MKNVDASPNIDRRVARSKASIRDALVSLITEHGFDAVTVNDIAARADINRGTFYLHYRDKFDLLEQTEDEVIGKIERIIAAGEIIKPEDLINFDKPLPVIVALFEYLRDNAALMHAILGLRGDVALQTKIRKSLERNLKFGALSGGRPLTFLAPAEYLVAYGLSASFGVVQLWLERGCAETPREMAVILTRLSLGGAVRAIVVG
ncbi:MAG: TetR/AcrR family transcriptional regulator [Anaerolineae bacterium]|nr:TetR/AcrR family transcriptional regulator [Anaerolineae bacterium]